ncbi:hypothetical protein SAMN05216266_12546 [Amycolatopsis marina]|uniref:Uncharacterized protein n=1 Tax=Amycolatopsis marina TaxID=490629 RepID=A0A1I1CCN2_9PSEU|nr:hypothetical protein [Amycolatopsis marina]SFB60324.1 hypothetical protein SAMN05216266_12546 [Amycolatopsis marina]
MRTQESERPDRGPVEGQEPEENSAVKPIQVAAAALAAITAAFVGSSLGVYGTVLGAGIISIATTVGSEIYLRSLRRTKEAARRTRMIAALTDARTRQPRSVPVTVEAGAEPHDTTAIDKADPADTAMFVAEGDGESGNRRLGKLRWPLIIGTSVLAFVIGMLVLTGFELTTGNAVSGGTGNTVSKIIGGGAGQGREQQEVPAGTGGDVQPTESRSPDQGTEDGSTETSTPESSAPPETGESSTGTESSQPPASSVPSSQSSAPPADSGGDAGGAGSGVGGEQADGS